MDHWERYAILDTLILGFLSLYSVIRLIMNSLDCSVRYISRLVLRSILCLFSLTACFVYLVLHLNASAIGKDVIETFLTFLKVASCLALFFSLQEWDSVCKRTQVSVCRLAVVSTIMVLVIAVTGLTQLCSYFIRTHASTLVYFFANALASYVQMSFIMCFGCFRIFLTLKDLEDGDSERFRKQKRCLTAMIVVSSLLLVFGFFVFIASFLVELQDNQVYEVFKGLCGRFYIIAGISGCLAFQDIMDGVLFKIVHMETREEPLV